MTTNAETLDHTFHAIMQRLVETGQAPHYTELARALDRGVEEARRLLHAVTEAFVPSWLFPETDYIASFPPFNNLPTQHRITVDGQQRWFAQCGFESLAVTWLFPGRTVHVNAPCLDCGDPIRLQMQDGHIVSVEPAGTVGHLNHPWTVVKAKLPFI